MLAKWWKKLIITFAGVFANLLLARWLLTLVFTLGIKPISVIPESVLPEGSKSYLMPSIGFLKEKGYLSGDLTVGSVILSADPQPESIAALLGLSSGDELVSINGQPVTTASLAQELISLANSSGNTLSYLHDQELVEKTFACVDPCLLGIVFQPYPEMEILPIKMSFPQAMLAGLQEIKAEWDITMNFLWKIGSKLFSFKKGEAKGALYQLSGPVGIIRLWEVLFFQEGFLAFLAFASMISLALAFFNVLPIPALDGGRFVGILIQKIFRINPVNYAIVEGWINTIFFWLLMALWIVIILKDLVVFWGLKIPFF